MISNGSKELRLLFLKTLAASSRLILALSFLACGDGVIQTIPAEVRYGALQVICKTPKVFIFDNLGRPVGRCNAQKTLNLALEPGLHHLEFQSNGYYSQFHSITLDPDEPREIVIELLKEPD